MAKVLIIDDQRDNLTSIAALLRSSLPGVVTETAESGAEGIEKARQELPDTVLLDVRMPVMDGWETCVKIKSDPAIRHIPVILLTAVDTDSATRARGLNMGADAFLSKPIDPAELTAQVLAMLRIKRAEDNLREQRDSLDRLVMEKTKELREAEAYYRTLFNSTADAIFILDLDGRFREVNTEACRRLEYTSEELRSMSVKDICVPEDAALVSQRIAKIKARGHAIFEVIHVTRTGKLIPEEVHARLIGYEGQEALLSVVRDIAERKKMERALEESEALFRTAFQHADTGMAIHGTDGRFKKVNLALCGMLDYSEEELLTKTWMDVTHEEDLRMSFLACKEVAAGAGKIRIEKRFITQDDRIVWCITNAAPIRDSQGKPKYFISLFQNITDRKLAEQARDKAEKQLHRARKMEAIGTLAGGIAHDFNNILGIIIGYAEAGLLQIRNDNSIRSNLMEILVASHRAKDLVKQILTFSRHAEHEPRPVAIDPIVKETMKLLKATLPATIEVRTNIVSQESTVLADPTQIHQVLINLCTNAADAMQDTGGVLEVGVTRLEIGPTEAAQYQDLDCGHYLELRVSDTGHGIQETLLDRIFDPFFTTKDPSKGTGLGLAVVHGIVKAHGGAITVDSEFGVGSTFRVLLPQTEKSPFKRPEPGGALLSGKERILFVDDERGLVESWRKMLEILGYTVTARTSSLEALETFSCQPDAFDLVVTDQTMPHLTGIQLAGKLLDIRPELPVILCTGHSEQVDSNKAASLGLRRFIMKPLDLQILSAAIRKVFDDPE